VGGDHLVWPRAIDLALAQAHERWSTALEE
jgi:hypothetical protein